MAAIKISKCASDVILICWSLSREWLRPVEKKSVAGNVRLGKPKTPHLWSRQERGGALKYFNTGTKCWSIWSRQLWPSASGHAVNKCIKESLLWRER